MAPASVMLCPCSHQLIMISCSASNISFRSAIAVVGFANPPLNPQKCSFLRTASLPSKTIGNRFRCFSTFKSQPMADRILSSSSHDLSGELIPITAVGTFSSTNQTIPANQSLKYCASCAFASSAKSGFGISKYCVVTHSRLNPSKLRAKHIDPWRPITATRSPIEKLRPGTSPTTKASPPIWSGIVNGAPRLTAGHSPLHPQTWTTACPFWY
mmetsp:Transcript_12557/g.27823  ORF Transcript_12557/g.27823 Transcript_12557/m.27823 type:complete len:213 (-) Transcript_12557:492-1130(-)